MSEEADTNEIPPHLACIGPAAREWIMEPKRVVDQLARVHAWITELEGQDRTMRGMRNVRLHQVRKTMSVREIEAATGIGRSTITKH